MITSPFVSLLKIKNKKNREEEETRGRLTRQINLINTSRDARQGSFSGQNIELFCAFKQINTTGKTLDKQKSLTSGTRAENACYGVKENA